MRSSSIGLFCSAIRGERRSSSRPQEGSRGRFAGVALLDAGHADYADWPTAEAAASVEELIEAARPADDVAVSWVELEAEVEEAYPGQEWMLDFFRAGTRVDADGRVVAIAPAEVRGAAFHGLIRARPSLAWPVLQAAGTPGLLLLATVLKRPTGRTGCSSPRFATPGPTPRSSMSEGPPTRSSRSSRRRSVT